MARVERGLEFIGAERGERRRGAVLLNGPAGLSEDIPRRLGKGWGRLVGPAPVRKSGS